MTRYICTLPRLMRLEIAHYLELLGIVGEDLGRAMGSRLCDLEDTIDIRGWL